MRGPSLYDLVLPGTHDSGAHEINVDGVRPTHGPRALSRFPLKHALRRTLTDFSRTHALDVPAQLDAGARFLDLRVAGVESSCVPCASRARDVDLWLVHGIVAAVPLRPVLEGVAAWQRAFGRRGLRPPAVVMVVRRYDDVLEGLVAALFREVLGASDLGIYEGDAAGLRVVPYTELPPSVVVGVKGVGAMPSGEDWGADVWIDTYNPTVKRSGLVEQARGAGARVARDAMYVLGWTVTPQTSDIAGRILSLGFAKPSLEQEAKKFNKEFTVFAKEHREHLQANVNVIFFDFFDRHLADAVFSINDVMPEPVPLE